MASDSNKTLWIILGVVGGVLLLGCLACGGVGVFVYFGAKKGIEQASDKIRRMDDLKQLGIAMHGHHDAMKRPPANLEELRPYMAGSQAVDRVQRNEIQVVWNAARFVDQVDGVSNVVFAWETKNITPNTRLVLLMDGSVQEIPESEFQRKPKPRLKSVK